MRLLKFLWWTCVTLICGVLLSFSGAYLYLSPSLPSVEALRNVQLQIPLKVYSEDGKLISEFGEMRRTPIRFADIPQDFIHALLSAEDDNFANHYGVDVKSLMRAAAQLLKSGHIQTGGSTITMQVAKNYFLTNERSFSRKINEILLALQIERQLTKDEILELYVNKIYLGNRAYGIEAAAQVYYGKPITGTIWFFTFGLFFIGWIIDLFLIPSMDREADRRFQGGNLDYNVAWILLTFLGVLGVHRMYMGKWITGIIYLFTGGLFFLGVLYDFWTLNGQVSERNGPQRI